ncbi:MAG: hypothetical protein AAF447_24760 [Myxococcota bacterium]
MVRGALVVLALLSRSESCGFDDVERTDGDPCTRDVDCGPELTCRAGLCQAPELDGGVDGGSADAAVAADGGP